MLTIKVYQVNAGTNLGKHSEPNVSGYSVRNKRNRPATVYETSQRRQKQFDAMQRTKDYQKNTRMQGKSPFVKKDIRKKESPEHTIELAQAAMRIQRAYRAHRAVKVLKDLEQRIRDAHKTHDGRNVLSYLRARSAEFSALSAFMSATPHISNNGLVNDAARRVADTLHRMLEKAKREEEERVSRSVIVHAEGKDNRSSSKIHKAARNNDTPDSDQHADLRKRIAMMYRASPIKSSVGTTKDAGGTAKSDNLQRRNSTHASASKVPKLLPIPENSGNGSS